LWQTERSSHEGAGLEYSLRKQYYIRRTESGSLIWDVDRLVELSRELPRVRVPLSSLRELDEPFWSDEDETPLTCRTMLEHMKLIEEADLSFPIILSADGRIMDGMHRVAKAALEGRNEIEAVQFEEDPEPDYLDRRLSDLPY
jgi:hypothetical protein